MQGHKQPPCWLDYDYTMRDPSSSSWWRHQMETFCASLALCAGNSPVAGEFPSQRPLMWSVDVFFDLRLNKRLSKQSIRWWIETQPRALGRHCTVTVQPSSNQYSKEVGKSANRDFLCCWRIRDDALSPHCSLTAHIFVSELDHRGPRLLTWFIFNPCVEK